MKSFTEEALLLYLYQETDKNLTKEIEAALEEDIHLQERLKVLQRSIKQLERLKKQSKHPREESVNSILAYAKKLAKK
ncbi:MAG: hypothetical protein K2W79_11845 [Hydrotalea flava]|uniref:hypothetical protein n=1 Tax=Hydrotalea TaxID=1004300 RepID=UPI00094369F1|nr:MULTISPECIES: hypothetical protein [Hydrotalea]MBY0348943.1 hypothetical protein [Hydrotalea flava]RWZ86411.1 MAG: hypothetical protein EO766_14350 [Hydrotalea sp. AMD]